MADMFKIKGSGSVEPIETEPFRDEVSDLERFLKMNPALLGDGLGLTGASGAGTGWNIWIKLPSPSDQLEFSMPPWANSPKWDANYKQVSMTIPGTDADLGELEPLLQIAYEHVLQRAGI